jgi:dTDP-4-dehydrorhamnose reductase
MKVAIIGANGQLGSDLVKVFGNEAIPLTHRDLDVADLESVKILNKLRPEEVINTAAYVRVDDAELKVEKAFQVNAIGALNVAKACNELNAINVYISTDYVFNGSKGTPYVEEDVPNPLNVYGLSRYAGEIFTRNYSRKYYIIRVASLYGKAGASGKGGNFVETMITKARNKEEIMVVDDMVMSPTYTKDAAEMIKKILEKNLPFGIYHVTNSGYCSWYEFAGAIFEALDLETSLSPTKTNIFQSKAKRPMFSALESIRLRKYGLVMKNWKQALNDYLIEKKYL